VFVEYTVTARLEVVFRCVSYAEARLSYINYVCLSVCPSVTLWYCIKTAEHIVMLSSPHYSPFILVLCIKTAKQRWGMKMSQFSTNNLLYLRNG